MGEFLCKQKNFGIIFAQTKENWKNIHVNKTISGEYSIKQNNLEEFIFIRILGRLFEGRKGFLENIFTIKRIVGEYLHKQENFGRIFAQTKEFWENIFAKMLCAKFQPSSSILSMVCSRCIFDVAKLSFPPPPFQTYKEKLLYL